jgi:lysophospholipase L1-like esterase
MKEITNTAREELKTLQSDDLVVVWGGANDISKNNMKEAVKSLSGFVDTNKDLNVVLINSPHRYDLLPESCVNKEVAKFNRQVKKIMKLQSKVKILELTLDRYHFTTHGLHLNSKGKKVVSHDLAVVVQQLFNKANISPNSISIPWKDPPLNDTIIEIQVTNTTEEANNLTSSSYHRRNCPARRNPDFLWM